MAATAADETRRDHCAIFARDAVPASWPALTGRLLVLVGSRGALDDVRKRPLAACPDRHDG